MQSPQDPPHLKAWWEEAAAKISKQEKRRFNGMVIYTLWNLWKERNRRIFQNVQESSWQVAFRIKEDIAQKKKEGTDVEGVAPASGM
jgi:hypothetical protein